MLIIQDAIQDTYIEEIDAKISDLCLESENLYIEKIKVRLSKLSLLYLEIFWNRTGILEISLKKRKLWTTEVLLTKNETFPRARGPLIDFYIAAYSLLPAKIFIKLLEVAASIERKFEKSARSVADDFQKKEEVLEPSIQN
jgi:hypothetical protein